MEQVRHIAIGDEISFYNEEANGFVCCFKSSSAHNTLYTVCGQGKSASNQVPNVLGIRFQIYTENRYKLGKRYRKLLAKQQATSAKLANGNAPQSAPVSIAGEDLASVKEAAAAEDYDNKQEQLRCHGKPLRYGDVIQFKHIFSNKWVHISTADTSRLDKSNILLTLQDHNVKAAQFKIQPRFKVKELGDLVGIDDEVTIESVKNPSHYWHLSKPIQGEASEGRVCEVNLGGMVTGFTIMKASRSPRENDHSLRWGQFVQFFHRDLEAFIASDYAFGVNGSQYVHLREKSLRAYSRGGVTNFAATFWQLEEELSAVAGDEVAVRKQMRIRHVTTQRYLSVNPETLRVYETANRDDPMTVFHIYPQSKAQDVIFDGDNVAVENSQSKTWLHAGESRREEAPTSDNNLIDLLVSEVRQYNDTFTLYAVSTSHMHDCNFVAGMCTVLQRFAAERNNKTMRSVDNGERLQMVFSELREFLSVSNEKTRRYRQQLMRSFKMVDLLIQALQTSDSGERYVYSELLDEAILAVLFGYVLGTSRKNVRYLSKYLDYFENRIICAGLQPQSTLRILVEMVRNRPVMISAITPIQLDRYIQFLLDSNDTGCLDLLRALCCSDAVCFPENQVRIAKNWLTQENLSAVYRFEMHVENSEEVVLISQCENGRQADPVRLLDFAKKGNKNYSDQKYLFVLRQLELFRALCAGCNTYCIDLVSQFLPASVVLRCVCDANLPFEIRIRFCAMVANCYIKTDPQQVSTLDASHNVFDFAALKTQSVEPFSNAGSSRLSRKSKAMRASVDLRNASIHQVNGFNLAEFRKWLSQYLPTRAALYADNPNGNRFLAEIIKLVHELLLFRHFTEDDANTLIEPIVEILDGTTDLPSRNAAESSKMQKTVHHYRQVGRFADKDSHIPTVKTAGVGFLDAALTLTIRQHQRQFLESFKHFVNEDGYNLSRILYHPDSLSDAEEQTMRGMSYSINPSIDLDLPKLSAVLQDLAQYADPGLLEQSVILLQKLHSSVETHFGYCRDTLLLVSESSLALNAELANIVFVFQSFSLKICTAEDCKTVISMLKRLTDCCYVTQIPCLIPNSHNQNMLLKRHILKMVIGWFQAYQTLLPSVQRPEILDVIRASLHLIQAIVLRNPEAQMHAYRSIDVLFELRQDVPVLAETLLHVFEDNLEIGIMIHRSQIDKMVSLVYAERDPITQAGVPEVLRMLINIIKLQKSGVSFKRSQKLLIKRLTESYKLVFGILELPDKQKEHILAGHCGRIASEYFVGLVELLSYCAENDSLSIETLCHNLLPYNEVLRFLSGQHLLPEARAAFYNYFNAAFLNKIRRDGQVTKRGEKLMKDLLNLQNFWAMLEQLCQDFGLLDDAFECVKISYLHEFTVSQFCGSADHVKRCSLCDWFVNHEKPSKRMEPESVLHVHRVVHLALNGLVPLVPALIAAYLPNDEKREFLLTEDHLHQFSVICRRIEPKIRGLFYRCAMTKHRRCVVQAIEAVSSFTSLRATAGTIVKATATSVPVDFDENDMTEFLSTALKTTDENYESETELNAQFQKYVDVCEKLYQGKNSVHDQLRTSKEHRCCDKPYSTESNPMPLGPQFQEFIRCYNDEAREKNGRYLLKRIRPVINFLTIVAQKRAKQGRHVSFDDSAYIRRCLQLLRAIIHNRERMMPDDWQDGLADTRQSHKAKGYLNDIDQIQNALARNQIFYGVIPHLADKQVRHEVLRTVSSLLFTTNTFVQTALYDYVVNSRDETIFREMHKVLEHGGAELKKRRHLRAQLKMHQMTQTKINAKKMNGHAPPSGNGDLTVPNGHAIELQELPATSTAQAESAGMIKNEPHNEDNSAVKNNYEKEANELTLLALEVAAALCDGQHRALQNLLRSQPENAISYNVVADIINFLRILTKQVDEHSVEEIGAVCDALNEICCGNQNIREELHHNKMVEYINHLLSESNYPGCSRSNVLNMQINICQLVLSLIEENGPESSVTAARLKDTIDLFAIVRIITECHRFEKTANRSSFSKKDQVNQPINPTELEELVELHVNVGRYFAVILTRLEDIDDTVISRLPANEEAVAAIDRFQHQLMSIEIVKDNVLQKVNFHVSERRILRETVKNKAKWDIERDSHATKVKELIEWTTAMIKDMEYTRRLLRFRPALWMMVSWRWVSILATVLAYAINIYLLIVTKASAGNYLELAQDLSVNPLSDQIDKPSSVVVEDEKKAVFGLCIVHNVLSGIIMMSFFVLANPSLPRFEWFHKLKNKFRPEEKKDDIEDDEEILSVGATSPNLLERETERSVQTSLLSVSTLYYLAYITLSICGTAVNPLFFVFHLFHIILINKTVQRIMRAISKNGWSLFWVLVLVLLVMYYFGVAAVLWFRSTMNPAGFNGGPRNMLFCETFLQCVISIGWNGLENAIYSNEQPFPPSVFSRVAGIAVFQVAFSIIISIILMSAVLIGIVVDTFAELREERSEAEKDMRERCFICDIKSHYFEHHGLGFRHHTKNDHNMWAYVYYFYYLETTPPEDYSAIDLYVSRCIQVKNYDFLPFEQALVLSREKKEDLDMKTEQIENKVTKLLKIHAEDYKRRIKREEMMKQRKWLSQVAHRSTLASSSRERDRSETTSTGSGDQGSATKPSH